MNIGSRIYIRLIYHAVCGDGHPKTGFRECMYKGSVTDGELVVETRRGTYLIAPAAVLGPNHWPTSFPRSFPASAMRWTLKGAWGNGESRNQVKIWT